MNLPVIQPSSGQDDARLASRVQRRQQSNKTAYDRRHGVVTPDITEGDYVCVRRPGHRSKTARRFTSPIRVTKRVGPATYRLADGRTWNAAHLARFPAEQPESPMALSPSTPTAAGPGESASTASVPEVVAPDTSTSPAAVPDRLQPDAVGPDSDRDRGSRRGNRVRRQPDFYVP